VKLGTKYRVSKGLLRRLKLRSVRFARLNPPR
jgi:hypothetical protein